MNSIKDHILQLEQELLKSEVRKSANKIMEMIFHQGTLSSKSEII